MGPVRSPERYTTRIDGWNRVAKKKSKKAKPELRVVLDTNVLYTKPAHYLFSRAVSELITETSTHDDLKVVWYLPEVVVGERRYQMKQAAAGLLPWIQQMERLLGHNLNITAQVCESRVNDAIQSQLTAHAVEVLNLDVREVNWDDLIVAAVDRLPPFDAGEKEKGFRDALICEAFFQLVSDAPATPGVCRVVLVSGDERLREAADARTKQNKNVRVLASIDDLKGLINTLVSKVGEEFVQKHLAKATRFFFTKDDETSLYYRENVRERVREEFGSELSALPPGTTERENGNWLIAPPRFVRKDARRVFWSSRIAVEAETYRRSNPDLPNFDPRLLRNIGRLLRSGSTGALSPPETTLSSTGPTDIGMGGGWRTESQEHFVPPVGRRVLVLKGRTVFDVRWSVSIAPDEGFRAARLEEVRFVETAWE